MVLNAAVQMLREADELKQKILKFKSGTSMLQERGLWATQQQLQKIYQKVLVLDLDYALDKKVEQDLWNIGFKQQIEALQTISKDRKNPLRSEGQAMLSWVLQAAAGFYLCLLHQICTTFKLDLPFRRRASLLGWVEGWGAGGAGCAGARLPPPAAARYICQHCLVHLGDLARYRHNLRVAYTFYRHALVVSAHSGQPYNQLALVSWRRGRRLGALYWHVRSLLVRAPFPPAPNNLARTLRAAAANGVRSPRDLPVLGFPATGAVAVAAAPATRLDAHGYVSELIRAMHYVHTVEELDTAEAIVEKLNSSLTALVATDSFESMTLIKMAVVLIWLCTSSCEGAGDAALSALAVGERRAARLAQSLATAAVLALALPAHTAETPPPRTLPALVVWLQWICSDDTGAAGTLGGGPALAASPAWAARPQLWPALAHVFNQLAGQHKPADKYERVPLPEDEELQGFLPLESALRGLRFAGRAAWDAYGARQTADGQNGHDGPDDRDDRDDEVSCGISATCLSNSPSLEHRVRAHRLLSLARRLSAKHPDRMQCSSEDGACHFTATDVGGAGAGALTAALAALAAGAAADTHPAPDDEADSDDDAAANARPPPPIVISEADFREKVREKRVGILKPQGSLERAREERAMACTQDDLDDMADDSMKGEDKKEIRKPRVNIAMAAIMRKQEETNKQVKFVTPPPTPESAAEQADSKEQDKPKVIQPKAIKSLANLPIGRKTGGILSLKDKSAGYPHLVNADPEPRKEKEDKEAKPGAGPGPGPPQPYQQKRHELPHWAGGPPAPAYEPRGFPAPGAGAGAGGYGGPAFAPPYPPPAAGIRLPVVNPKEIDVRTAALQKQNSRQDLFPDGPKFAAHGYQISGDKKNFLNDLPPRFANQYRYWQSAQETQYGENKFRDDGAKAGGAPFGGQRGAGGGGGGAWPLDAFAAPPPAAPWWKPDAAPYGGPYPPPAYYSPPVPPAHAAHGPGPLANPYQTMPSYSQMQNQSIGQPSKPEGYGAAGGGGPTLAGLAAAPSFASPLGGFGSYAPAAGYDAAMYPQFGKLGYQPLQMKMLDKPYGKELELGALPFGDPGLRAPALYGDPRPDINMTNNMDQNAGSSERNEAGQGSTYSLFSGAPAAAGWGQHHPHQSLWSGPGPSPLERLLEQQKQLKAPIAPAPHPAPPQ